MTVNVTATMNTLIVDTASDVVDGDTSSVNALIANPGTDGLISLREAIMAADNTVSATPITIDFDIPGSGVQTINVLSATASDLRSRHDRWYDSARLFRKPSNRG